MSKPDCEHDKFENNGDGSMTCLDCRLEFRPEEICEHDTMVVYPSDDTLVCLDCGLKIPSCFGEFDDLLEGEKKEDKPNETNQ